MRGSLGRGVDGCRPGPLLGRDKPRIVMITEPREYTLTPMHRAVYAVKRQALAKPTSYDSGSHRVGPRQGPLQALDRVAAEALPVDRVVVYCLELKVFLGEALPTLSQRC